MRRSKLYANPDRQFLADVILAACADHAERLAIVDTSCEPHHKLTYAEYGDHVVRCARGLVAAGVRPGDIVGIFLANSWEFAVAFHAITLVGATPTTLNPTYREREVRYQLEASSAVVLITDGALIAGMHLGDLPLLRAVYTTRTFASGAMHFVDLLLPTIATLPSIDKDPRLAVAALPFSSGTTGLPKGVMLSHTNLVTNVYQTLTPGEVGSFSSGDVMLCFLPLYHIYGMTVGLNLMLTVGGTLVLMPRFDTQSALRLIVQYGITVAPCVPPVLNAFCVASENGLFPKQHRLKWVKCGAAPLSPELARRFTDLTGIPVRQGYGMTEASPVTHIGFLEPELYKPDSIGMPVAQTDCRIVDDSGRDVRDGEIGELVIRGPQVMLGYWQAPDATDFAIRNGWYYSGDVARRDERGFYYIVDRRKEMIKYKGFAIAPAEVEAVLMEHAAVRDCGVVARADDQAGEIPCAFVVLRQGGPGSDKLKKELMDFVGERLTNYKRPREIIFLANIPRNPSGKILRRHLRELF